MSRKATATQTAPAISESALDEISCQIEEQRLALLFLAGRLPLGADQIALGQHEQTTLRNFLEGVAERLIDIDNEIRDARHGVLGGAR